MAHGRPVVASATAMMASRRSIGRRSADGAGRLMGGQTWRVDEKEAARIRAQRELLDLRYRVERQTLLSAIPGKPANVEFYASTMRVGIALLHEEDLLRFLADLRESGNAYYSVRRCAVTRTGQAATGTTITPRLRAECEIDLITIMDRAAKR